MKNIINYIQEAIVKGHISKKNKHEYELYEGKFKEENIKYYIKVNSYLDIEYLMQFQKCDNWIKEHTLDILKSKEYPMMVKPYTDSKTVLFGHNPVNSTLTKYVYLNKKIEGKNFTKKYWEEHDLLDKSI